MLLNIYLFGSLLTMIAAVVACARQSHPNRVPFLTTVLAGALWPVLAIGGMQMIAVTGLAKSVRKHAAAGSMTRH